MTTIKVNDQVIYKGQKHIVEALYPDMNSNGRPVTAILSAHGQFAGRAEDNREVGLSSVKPSEDQLTANKYGISLGDLQFEWMWFIENEGFLENGFECHTFEQWLNKKYSVQKFQISEPYQKGDLGYGL